MLIERAVKKDLIRLSREYPVVTITGPRQSGKTTLMRNVFPDKPYVSLEDLDSRNIAIKDPRHFLSKFPDGAVIDEIQRAPDLISYIQTIVDNSGKSGMFILTGSAQFELIENINQSLAGRTAILRLLPFSYEEIKNTVSEFNLSKILFTGFFPRIYDKNLNPLEALSFYVNTYVERDVRRLLNIKNLSLFETFLRLCAARSGQILNLSSLGNDCGIDHNTASSWISILEASYIIFRIQPHHRNFSKRLTKSPKIYFYDVGLMSYLLGIQEALQLETHPLRGQLFETYAVSEIIKKRYNSIKNNNMFYFRDNVGNEIDIILDYGEKTLPIEIKAGMTFSDDMLKGLKYYGKLAKGATIQSILIYGGEKTFDYNGFSITSFRDIEVVVK